VVKMIVIVIIIIIVLVMTRWRCCCSWHCGGRCASSVRAHVCCIIAAAC
jgi:hypothetical protein